MLFGGKSFGNIRHWQPVRAMYYGGSSGPIRESGYEGLVYRSQFGESGHNIALFDVQDADIINAAPYQVTSIDVKFEETGNRWYSNKHYNKSEAKN